ncbi:MAG: tetratricopeptide repeat protein [Myxococcota bacterium]
MWSPVLALGLDHLRSGSWDEAAIVFRGLISVEPRWGYLQLALALAEDRRGATANALQAVNRATELEPGEPRSWLLSAELLRGAGDRERAVECLERAAVLLQAGCPDPRLLARMRLLRNSVGRS